MATLPPYSQSAHDRNVPALGKGRVLARLGRAGEMDAHNRVSIAIPAGACPAGGGG